MLYWLILTEHTESIAVRVILPTTIYRDWYKSIRYYQFVTSPLPSTTKGILTRVGFEPTLFPTGDLVNLKPAP